MIDSELGALAAPARARRRAAVRYGGAALGVALTSVAAAGVAAPAAAADLEGAPWLALFYAGPGPAGRLLPVLPDTEVTATFQRGVVSGAAGCNSYSAGYSLAGGPDALRIGPVAATRMACAEPPGVMEQEAAYLGALPTAQSYRFEGPDLVLERAGGARVARYTPGGS